MKVCNEKIKTYKNHPLKIYKSHDVANLSKSKKGLELVSNFNNRQALKVVLISDLISFCTTYDSKETIESVTFNVQ